MKKLRQLRKLAGITQIELAQRTGIDRVKLSFAENGHVELTREDQARIIKVISKAVKDNQASTRSLLGTSEDQALIAASA